MMMCDVILQIKRRFCGCLIDNPVILQPVLPHTAGKDYKNSIANCMMKRAVSLFAFVVFHASVQIHHISTSGACLPNCSRLRLQSLVVIMRHSDRNPRTTFPNNPHPPDDLNEWPEGARNLNKNGAKHAKEFASWIRGRYIDFFNNKDVIPKITTETLQRHKETASIISQALFGREVNQTLDHEMLGDPNKHDLEQECPLLMRLQHEYKSLPKYKEYTEEYNKFLAKATNWTLDQVKNVSQLHTTLYAMEQAGKSMPGWLTDEVAAKIDERTAMDKCLVSVNPDVPSLRSLPILSDLREKLINSKNEHQFLLYVTHGYVRVGAVLRVLFAGADKRVIHRRDGDVAYNEAVIIEFYKSAGERLLTRSYFVSPSKNYLVQPLYLAQCRPDANNCDLCPIASIFSKVGNMTRDRYTKLCQDEGYANMPEAKTNLCFDH